MQLLRKSNCFGILLLLGAVLLVNTVRAGNGGIIARAVLDGSLHQIKADSSVTVQDSAFFNPAYAGSIDTSYRVQNLVTLKINEASFVYLRTSFTVTVHLRLVYSNGANAVDSIDRNFTVSYDSAHPYNSRSNFVFSGAHRVTVKVLSVTSSVSSWDPLSVLLIENQLVAKPDFAFSCTGAVTNISVSTPAAGADELPVSWTAITGADQYDLEWTYIDKSALDSNRYGNPINKQLIFRNNATRISTTATSYSIPLIYDDSGTLFIRVRPTQIKEKNAVLAAEWSSDAATPVMGQFSFIGHERPLNWQSHITFAEEGKRKVVLQYYDGSLRSRQTVTKDNSTNTTIVGETYYDYQGRPAIQVMPSPTLNNVIQYAASFNVTINNAEYTQSNYDTLPNPGTFCSIHADPMGDSSGASRYYSPYNTAKNIGMNQFIPDAHNYPFTETEYTQDNTGRISRQGGVGPDHQLGSGHETKYYYGTPDQDEIDALFGTDVGDHSHYLKNMVRDANGQYTISYVDMHGRKIATSMAGNTPAKLASLPFNTGGTTVTENLSTPGTVFFDGNSILSQKSLLVSSAGNYQFHYGMTPDSITVANCNQQNICYTCLYDLEVTITDNCNNQLLGGHPFDTVLHNFSFGAITPSCTGPTPMSLNFTLPLDEGSYVVTKRLTANKDAYVWYRDSVYLPNNTCRSFQDFVNEQKSILAQSTNQCAATCTACRDSLGTWDQYWTKYIAKTGLTPADTAAYHDQVYQSYLSAQEACNALCGDSLTDAEDIRNAMLQDMTPPFGQYADTSKLGDLYSIFYIPAADSNNYTPVYRLANVKYLNDNMQPDSVFNITSNLMVTPNTLTFDQFTQNFRSSWAEALLKYHPEYCKLQTLESLKPSNVWDRRMEGIDNFRDAYNQGFLNPTGNATFSRYPIVTANIDPLLQLLSGSASQLNAKLTTYMASSSSGGQTNPALSMWAMACLEAKCNANDLQCANKYANAANDFDTTAMCPGDLDMAWRFFRQLYLQYKQDLVNNVIIATRCTPANTAYGSDKTTINSLLADSLRPEFNTKTGDQNNSSITSQSYLGNINTKDTAKQAQAMRDSVNSYYTQNIDAYVTKWASQLSTCQYGQDLQDTILPRLKGLCRLACDAGHPFGASTLPNGVVYTPAGTAYQFTSFQDIIDTYNQLHSISTSVSCNAELITAPAPYYSQPAYSNKPVYGKPSDCECSAIRSLYTEYKVTGRRDASFSAWMLRTRQTAMSESDLSELLALCGNSSGSSATCSWLSHPISLPPALQCNVGSVCVSCTFVDSVYHNYLQRYPSDTPTIAANPDDSIQLAKNKLFENYMNNRLGFTKEAWEYLVFMDSCTAHSGDITNSTECLPGQLGNIFNSGGTDQLSDIHATADKGYIIAGNTSGVGAGGKDAYVAKAGHDGAIQWAKTYGGSAEDRFIRIKQTSDNGYIAIGTTKSAAFSRGEMLLVKMTAAGATQWSRAIGFGTSNGEYGYDVIQTADGGYAALGVYNQHGGTGDLMLARIDTGGTVTWVHRYGVGVGDNNSSCTIDDVDTINYNGSPAYGLLEHQDTLLLSGTSFDPNMGARYFGVVYRVDETAGDLIGSWHYADNADPTLSTWFGDLHATSSGYLLSVSNAPHFGSVATQTAIARLSPTGNVNSFVRFDLPPGNSGIASAAMYPAADGGVLVGQTGNLDANIFWQRVDISGNLLWSSVTDMPGAQALGRITRNADSSFTAVGTTDGHTLLLNLLATAATGCYDSTIDLELTTPTLTKINWAVEASQSLNLASTNANLAESSLELSDSSLACSQVGQCYNVYNGPTLCGKSSPLMPTLPIDSTTTCTDSTFFAVSKATELYKVYTDSLTGDFEQRYMNTCMQAYKHESFTVTYTKNEYHYTLYYYDQAGNLVRTVPPAGAQPNFDPTWLAQVKTARDAGTVLVPAHKLTTEYRYNSLNLVVSESTPDGGVSTTWYDRLGRICLSQNAKQGPNNQYSYTQYDSIGRTVQEGQLVSATVPTDSITRNESALAQWMVAAASTADQIIKTVYDYPYAPLEPELSAINVRDRVAWTAFYNTAADLNNSIPLPASATYYSYDILGNVDTLVQDYGRGDYPATANVMNTHGNRFKKIVYDFDLLSGKVNLVSYQPGQPDAFYHAYVYDAQNRITNVMTSTDSINWDNEAFYSYYAHGLLARTVLGEQQVQGVNYAYTLQGWLKVVNPAIYSGSGYTLQRDGSSGSVVGASAYSYILGHYKGDYMPVSGDTPPDTLVDGTLGSEYRPLFNGNINTMGVNITALGHPLLYNYQYDQLNRLVRMDAWNRTGAAWNNISKLQDFAETIRYDPNGNILGYKRNGNNTFAGSPLGMDSLNYTYIPGSNQLDHVSDSVPSGNYTTDIDNQLPGNYRYDPIGNLVFDTAAGITEIRWSVYGKISHISKTDGSTLTYTYDVSGNRIGKVLTRADSVITTWYVRDAQGTVLSVYTAGSPAVNSGHVTQTESDIYGTSRLGMLRRSVDVQVAPSPSDTSLPSLGTGRSLTFVRGNKLFELANHLGNVLVTVSDKKYGFSLNDSTVDHFTPEVVGANDYYPFGMLQPGRTYSEASAALYRYGFNGKEMDNDIEGNGNIYDYGFRIYNPQIGRFLSTDPLAKSYPWFTPYQFAGNGPILNIDLDGLENTPTQPNTSASSDAGDLHKRALAMIAQLKKSIKENAADIKKAEKIYTALDNIQKSNQAALDKSKKVVSEAKNAFAKVDQGLKQLDFDLEEIKREEKERRGTEFVFDAQGKVTKGKQIGFTIKAEEAEVGVKINAGSRELASGAIGFNPGGDKPGKWGAEGERFSEGNGKYTEGYGVTVTTEGTKDFGVGVSWEREKQLKNGQVVSDNGGGWNVNAILPILKMPSAGAVKESKQSPHFSMKPSWEKTGTIGKTGSEEERKFFGLEIGIGIACYFGLEGSIRIGVTR